MEKTARKLKMNPLFLILALLLVIALAVGLYFLIGSGRSKAPNRGTYVHAWYGEVSKS